MSRHRMARSLMRAKRSTIAVGFGNKAQRDWWKPVPSNHTQDFGVEARVIPRQHFFNLGTHHPGRAQLGKELSQNAWAEQVQASDCAPEPNICNLGIGE